VSFFVHCETQQEADELWEKLSLGGEKGRCDWPKDKYGLSWQRPGAAAVTRQKTGFPEPSDLRQALGVAWMKKVAATVESSGIHASYQCRQKTHCKTAKTSYEE
jgi:hypothetical protein